MANTTLQKLEFYLYTVPRQFQKIPQDLLLERPAPGKWSKLEILGHLIDSALHNWQRVSIARETTGPYILQPYLQAELVRNNAYQEMPRQEVLELWLSLNRQMLGVCRRLSPEQLKKEIHVPYDNMETDLAFLIDDYVVHLEHHLTQIFGTLEALQQPEGWRITLAEAMAALEQQKSPRDIVLKERGSLVVEYYAPRGVDGQQPHQQDELYLITSGEGQYFCDGQRQPFQVGDILFAPAGVVHRFENFSDDLGCWVIFYGPVGGEKV